MTAFKSDGDRLEYALGVLRNISEIANLSKTQMNQDEGLSTIDELASSAVLLIEKSQREPAVDMNDLLLEMHETM